ncbi:hypothetical protein Bca52824_020852 [Brassica carinata]|uniref:Uncharacterized protein n=1 Tax=Brassica carinata TaxID=52824 RepID=A0A8X7VVS1_BRACI|nr:hypothetical protein Bca52824_020852 [Brassica carinata]
MTKGLARRTATDPNLEITIWVLRDRKQYRMAITGLDRAKYSLASGDVRGHNIFVSKAMAKPKLCQDEMLKVKGDPSLVKHGEDFHNICSILLVISKMML